MSSRPPGSSSISDERLVKECLRGSNEAWSALLAKYRNLIYSIPLKYGLSADAANDVFQQTCLQLLRRLEHLRDAQSLPAWLIKVTAHQCLSLVDRERRFEQAEFDGDAAAGTDAPEKLLRELEQEQLLRDAMSQLKPRCRELFQLLFFEEPAAPYAAAAKRLGLAPGSIGFVRMRCLQQLRHYLEERGFV
jgi:RNA polymerase sigma factor (sigma-70 family)